MLDVEKRQMRCGMERLMFRRGECDVTYMFGVKKSACNVARVKDGLVIVFVCERKGYYELALI